MERLLLILLQNIGHHRYKLHLIFGDNPLFIFLSLLFRNFHYWNFLYLTIIRLFFKNPGILKISKTIFNKVIYCVYNSFVTFQKQIFRYKFYILLSFIAPLFSFILFYNLTQNEDLIISEILDSHQITRKIKKLLTLFQIRCHAFSN